MEIREFILSYIRDGNEIIDSKFDIEDDKNESIDFENMDEISAELSLIPGMVFGKDKKVEDERKAYNNEINKLSNLILELDKIEDLKRIRYTTSHPRDLTEDLIDSYSNSNASSDGRLLPDKYSKKAPPAVET